MKAVLLAGGLGTRLREETEYRPKPMVEIGDKPILWHIMKMLSVQNVQDFVVCLGYKGDVIKEFFINYESRINDITVSLGNSTKGKFANNTNSTSESWNVTLANTGAETMTGGRIKKIKKYVDGETFLCTYGDGLANIDLPALLNFHKSHGKIATLTAVRPTSRFGALEILENSSVHAFKEKPQLDQWINGGFFIFNSGIFDYLVDDSPLEAGPLEKLSQDNQLMAYRHSGFWQPMDTYRETQELNALWRDGSAPWKNW